MDERREATTEERARLAKACREGRIAVETDKADALTNLMHTVRAGNKLDWTLTKVEFLAPGERAPKAGGGFQVTWQTKSAGFGELVVYLDKDGKLRCDNETMSKDFIKKVLYALVDAAELDS